MKTKLGVSVGLLAAAMYFSCLFSTYIPMLLVAGYVLLCEEDQWLKKTVVKAFAFSVVFSILKLLVGFIPDLLNIANEFFNIFRKTLKFTSTPQLIKVLSDVISLVEEVFFLLLGLLALKQQTIKIGFIDKFVDTHMGQAAISTSVSKAATVAQPKKEAKTQSDTQSNESSTDSKIELHK